MRRRLETAFAASPSAVRDAVVESLDLAADADEAGGFTGMLSGTTGLGLHVVVDGGDDDGDDAGDDGGGNAKPTPVQFEAASHDSIPYFGWFVNLLRRIEAGRALRYSIARVTAALDGTDEPEPPRRISLLPPVAFTAEQTSRLAAIALVAASASFCGALFTQNGDAVTDTFHRSDADLGWALAISRVGVLVSLVAAGLSDRFGRRRTLLVCVAGAAIANGVTAVAPTFGVFTVVQLFTRAFVNAVLVIAGLAAVEDAPEGARAFALSMFGLAFGLGFALSVILLPLADLGANGWRIAFGASALIVLVIPSLRRHLRETTRYENLEARAVQRGRIREVFDRQYGMRFVLLGLVAFLTNVFQAPSSQLTNRYLHREHDFSNSETALFRTVTAGVPGVIGVVAGGRLSESRGRRPVTIIGILIASVFQMSFFLSGGPWLWISPMIAIIAALAGGLALGALDTELFPTEVRGTSNGFLLVCGVFGSVVGLIVATNIKNAVGGLGPAIALCGIAPLIAALFIVPRLPETVDRKLDDISPTESIPPELGGTA